MQVLQTPIQTAVSKMHHSAPAKINLQRIIAAEPKATSICFVQWVNEQDETTEMVAIVMRGAQIRMASTIAATPDEMRAMITGAEIHIRSSAGDIPRINPRNQCAWICDDIDVVNKSLDFIKVADLTQDGMPLILQPTAWGPRDHVHNAVMRFEFNGTDFVKHVYNESGRPPTRAVGICTHASGTISVFLHTRGGSIIRNSGAQMPPPVWRHIHCTAEQAGRVSLLKDVITWIGAPEDITYVREKIWPPNNTWIFVH